MHLSKRLLCWVGAVQLGVTGCATLPRLPAVPSASTDQARVPAGEVRYFIARETESFAAEARATTLKEEAWLASQGVSGERPPAHFLAISGGGEDGAFGAGFLNGWTVAGGRPEFNLVTGVSTGALIAPFAFLGPQYDPVLEKFYTTTSSENIFKRRGLLRGLFGDAMADSLPLANMIEENVDQPLLDAIAKEYAKGRLLLVATTNLDSLEPVIWNLTAIASSKDPSALRLFRSVLLASASIPGAFPPVMIDVDLLGQKFQEMHVDGGVMTQVFAYPPSFSPALINEAAPRKRILYVIRNARFTSEWEEVPRNTKSIAARSIGSLIKTQGLGDLFRIFAASKRDGVEFNLAFIPTSFTAVSRNPFDYVYMGKLYDYGKQLAASGYQWHKNPPGFDQPIKSATGNQGANQ